MVILNSISGDHCFMISHHKSYLNKLFPHVHRLGNIEGRRSLPGNEQLCGDPSRAGAGLHVHMVNAVPCGYVPLDLKVA